MTKFIHIDLICGTQVSVQGIHIDQTYKDFVEGRKELLTNFVIAETFQHVRNLWGEDVKVYFICRGAVMKPYTPRPPHYVQLLPH